MLSLKKPSEKIITRIKLLGGLLLLPLAISGTVLAAPVLQGGGNAVVGNGIPISSNCQSSAVANSTNVDTAEVNTCLHDSPIVKDLNVLVDFLSGVVGVAVVGTIVFGGIQYAAAGDNPQSVSAAKKRITNGLIALLGFIFAFALLQWLIPGGIFG